jgi:predicted signal transduction protein with EAL and GGDEF domain
MKELSSPFTVGERILNVGASIGIAPFPSDGSSTGSTTTDILRHADMALYRAKHLGRNVIQFYEPEMHAAADERLELERGLRAALENDEFILHFQPFLDSVGQVIGAEALLRWQHPQTGVILPASFIPVAEETGLIHAIGAWVLDQVCERLIVWQQTGAPFCEDISVNVSPWQFARPDYVRQVGQILARHRVEPHHLTLEITETALLYDIEETIEKLKALRAMGLKVSLDDFGTGYSSLAYLKKLPLDQLKIDKSFVQDIEEERSRALVGDMISIGNHMRLDVIAEGVEFRTQRDILAEMGCGRFQGFLFCRPLAEPDFLRWLAENRMKSPHDVRRN